MKRQPKRSLDREPTAAECKAFNARKMALLDKAVLDADLTDFQQRLLSYIINKYLWKPGNLAYPGYDVLVEGFGASRSAIREALEQLEARNYLTCVMRGKRGRGENRANEYELGPGPQSYRRRVYKSKKSNAYENQSAATATVCGRNQSAATASTECRHGVNQSAAQTAPNSLEGTPLKEHTPSEGVCGNGKDKQEEPTPDSSDMTDTEALEFFRSLPDKEVSIAYRLPTNGAALSDGSPTNGHSRNGHNPTSPATDLDRAVATYLAGFTSRDHPKRASEKDVVEIRQELAKILEKDPIELVMAALDYHMTTVWLGKEVKFRSSPLGFLKNGTW